MPQLKFLFLALLFLPLAGWSKNAAQLPLREIDRSLVMPKGVWQELLLANFNETVYYLGYMPSLPSWAMTDRLTWVGVPMPYFEYLIHDSKKDSALQQANKGQEKKGLTVSLRGGMSDFSYSSSLGLNINYDMIVRTKWPISNHFWIGHQIGGAFFNKRPSRVQNQLGFGWQISNRTYALTRYHTNMSSKLKAPDDYEITSSPELDLNLKNLSHVISEEIGFHFTHNISLTLQPGIFIYQGDPHYFLHSAIAFQW
jgi:hypothetical protein